MSFVNRVRNILEILHHDEKPVRRLLAIVISKLPFDIGQLLPITIRIQDYFIRFRQCSMVIAFWLNPNDRISDYMFLTSYLKKNDIYIDVGANIGTTLIPAAKSIKGGKAIGFEPHPKIFKYLKENVSLNNLENSVELHNCALGNERGYLKFSSSRTDDLNKVIFAGEGINVPVKLLDDIVEHYSKIDLIKIDVEGYEKFVVEGGIKTLEKTQCIYLEVSEEQFGFYQYSMKDLLTMLDKMGFHLFIAKGRERLEPINCEYKCKDATNAIGIRNVEDFARRSGWRIQGDSKAARGS